MMTKSLIDLTAIKAAMGVHQKEYNRGSARTASGSV